MESLEAPEGPSKKRSERRRRNDQIKIRVDESERLKIEANAASARLPTADFLRRIGQGYVPESRIDQEAVRELCLAIGDLGRLGGLLKLWMSERRSGVIPSGSIDQKSIESIWQELQSSSELLKARVKKV